MVSSPGQVRLPQLAHQQADGDAQCRCHLIVIRNGPGSLHNAQLKLIRSGLAIRPETGGVSAMGPS